MCGIAGIASWHSDHFVEPIVKKMNSLLEHRGPDTEGVVQLPFACFAHRRLAIIDINGSVQPMFSTSNKTCCSFNGEIFNFQDLKKDLPKVHFRTKGDTEVLLELFEAKGNAAFELLNGQFAVAFAERESQQVTLARDYAGEKPLYYHHENGILIFASELKAVIFALQALDKEMQLDGQALYDFHSLNYVPGCSSFIKGINKVPPGSSMTFTHSKCTREFFSPPDAVKDCRGDSLETFSTLLEDAVKVRLVSDVPSGVYLSGGIDSTVLAVALKQLGEAPTCYIADFKNPAFSEAEMAVHVAEKLGLPYRRVPIPEVEQLNLALLQKLVWHADEPLADSSLLPSYLLAKAVKKDATVMLSGDGADELFAGYLTHRASRIAHRIPDSVRQMLRKLHRLIAYCPSSGTKVSLIEKLDRFLRNIDLPIGQAHFAWNGMFLHREKALLFNDSFLKVAFEDTLARLEALYELQPEKFTTLAMLQADQAEYMTNDILNKVDRASMAASVEVRPVFLDPSLIRFARTLSDSDLLNMRVGKRILRKYLAKNAPWYNLKQKKQGFSIPIHSLLRENWNSLFQEVLQQPNKHWDSVYNRRYIEKLFQMHCSKQRSIGFELWGILVSKVWMDTFLYNE